MRRAARLRAEDGNRTTAGCAHVIVMADLYFSWMEPMRIQKKIVDAAMAASVKLDALYTRSNWPAVISNIMATVAQSDCGRARLRQAICVKVRPKCPHLSCSWPDLRAETTPRLLDGELRTAAFISTLL